MKWYKANTSNGQGLIVDEKTGRNVAVSYDEKDANLISACPELLESLEEMVQWYEAYYKKQGGKYSYLPELNKAREVIDKAK